MAAEIDLLSMTQTQKLSQSQQHQNQNKPQPNPNSTSTSSWMWNPRENQDDDDSWEVRAFARHQKHGYTWPPRSYTCTFCRREFRSAQALGGHMNVHRRDRARLHHQAQPCSVNINLNSSLTSSFIIPAQELVANGGLCLLYHLPSPNCSFTTTPRSLNACAKSPSTLLSISPRPPNNLQMLTCSSSLDFPVAMSGGIDSSYCNSSKVEQHTSSSSDNNGYEELDLELRLGHRPTPTCKSPRN